MKMCRGSASLWAPLVALAMLATCTQATTTTIPHKENHWIHWVKVGEDSLADPVAFLFGLFDLVEVNVTTSTPGPNLKVFRTGGSGPEQALQYTGDPFNATDFALNSFFRVQCDGHVYSATEASACTGLQVPRFGLWAPFGATYIGVQTNAVGIKDMTYTISWHAVPPSEASRLMLRALVGAAIILLGGAVSHWRPMHFAGGALLGSLGIVLIFGYILMRLLPGKKAAVFFAGMTTLGSAWLYQPLKEAVWDHVLGLWQYYLASVLLGAFVGMGMTYRYPPGDKTQDIVLATCRLLGAALIFSAAPSAVTALCMVVAMLPLVYARRYLATQAYHCLCGRDDEDEDEDGNGEDFYDGDSEEEDDDDDDDDDDEVAEGDSNDREDPGSFLRRRLTKYISPEAFHREGKENARRELDKLKQTYAAFQRLSPGTRRKLEEN